VDRPNGQCRRLPKVYTLSVPKLFPHHRKEKIMAPDPIPNAFANLAAEAREQHGDRRDSWLVSFYTAGNPFNAIATTLGLRLTEWGEGETTFEWDAPPEYGFLTPDGPLIHGGMVATILDTAMGGACFMVLNSSEAHLTADLRVELLRPTRPGLLRAKGTVVRRTARVVFCAAELFDAEGTILAASRCTQVLRPLPASVLSG
jgi:uncharacterized protein (TIGR00369 family)